ncbi:MAG: hypothetical protein ACI3VB_06625 [Oscillospiraceae bacterium]
MEILKSRKTAALILAAVIIVFTPLGARLSLQRAADKVENMFYDGVYIEEEKYTSGAIADYLEDVIKNTRGLVTVGTDVNALSDETEALRSALNALIDAETIGEKYSANAAVIDSAEKFYNAAKSALNPNSVSYSELADTIEKSLSNLEEYYSNLVAVEGSIELNRYNDAVAEFEADVLGRFPAGAIANIFSIDLPDSFGGN